MCGILGTTEKINKEFLIDCIETFKYRGPDDTGVFIDENIAFSNVRLAIQDIDIRSNQPMFTTDNNISIVFNGEIYNFKEIKKELQLYYTFNTESDTEVILYAYKKYGSKCFELLHGMFAIAIYDKNNHKLILARDSYGIKPLYFCIKETSDGVNNISFASEIKGLIKLIENKIKLQINKDALLDLKTFGFIMSPNTLYNNIYKLEKSCILTFDLKSKKHHFDFYTQKRLDHKAQIHNNSLNNILKESINDHLISDKPIGLFYSGGIDSSLIAVYLKEKNIHLNAYTIVMRHKESDRKYISNIALKLGLNPIVYDFETEDFEQIYLDIMNKIDEPLFDASIFPTYFVSKIASKDVKVVLTGEGGDEFFYGYIRQLKLFKFKNTEANITWLDKLYFKIRQFRGKKRLFEKLFIFFRQPASYFLLNMSMYFNIEGLQRFKNYVYSHDIKPKDFDKEIYLENDLLRKIDMATSYNSIEGRTPFLYQNIKEYSEIFNDKNKLKLKNILLKTLSHDEVFRKKSGFSSPLSTFFKESEVLKNDMHIALNALKQNNIIYTEYKDIFDIIDMDIDKFVKIHPYLIFTFITMYHSLKNVNMI